MTDPCGLCMGTGNASRGMHDNGNYKTRCPRRFKGNYRACWPAPSRGKCHPLAEAEDVHQAAELGEIYASVRVYLYGTRRRNGEVPVLKLFRKGAFTGQRGRLYNCNYQGSFTPPIILARRPFMTLNTDVNNRNSSPSPAFVPAGAVRCRRGCRLRPGGRPLRQYPP